MENKDRLNLIKSLKNEIKMLEVSKKQISDKIKDKKILLEDITNNLINTLLKE